MDLKKFDSKNFSTVPPTSFSAIKSFMDAPKMSPKIKAIQ